MARGNARESTAHLTKLRISIVQYLNTAPLVWGFTNGPLRGKYELSFTVPSQCAEALRSRAADIAIIPAIEYQRIDDLMVLPGMAIASKRRVRSLLIVSKFPVQQVRSLALDSSSRSTQALTKMLCDRHWGIAPEFFEIAPDLRSMLQKADAALVIGDPALRLSFRIDELAKRGRHREQVCAGSEAGLPGIEKLYIYDVVEQWRRMTRLPAVLAVWAARTQVVSPEVVDDFRVSRDLGRQHVREISEQAAAGFGVPARQLQRYLTKNIDFGLDEENLRGLEKYFVLAAQMGLIHRINPISIASTADAPARLMDFVFAKHQERV